jgi:hypothetical protein
MKAHTAAAIALLAFLTVGASSAKVTLRRTASGEDRTITKVVKMLETMLEKSKVDGDADREIYSKFVCYCNDKKAQKTKEIDELTKVIALLEDDIAKLKGSSGVLSVELAKLKADKAANREQVEAATAIRDKENQAYIALRDDLTTAIGQMKEALATLSEIGADQTLGDAASDHKQFMAGFKGASLVKLQAKVQQALTSASAFLKPPQAQSVKSFLQAPFTGTYTAQSGEVVGILKQMKDTFEANLESATAAEETAQKAFDEFIEAKEAEYEKLVALEEEKQRLLADNDASLATKSTQLEDSKADKAVREEFLEQLLPLCDKKKEEYDHRQTMRANEELILASVTRAICWISESTCARW